MNFYSSASQFESIGEHFIKSTSLSDLCFRNPVLGMPEKRYKKQ